MSKYMRQAVALAYGKNPIPVVTAKGDDDLAMRMIDEARKQGHGRDATSRAVS